jgi:acetyl-CoA carboxylase biotin carboxyl carrier protein
MSVEPAPAEEFDTVLRKVAGLLSGLPSQPSALRVRTGDVSLELEWAEQSPRGGPLALADGPTTSVETSSDQVDYVFAPTVGVFYRAPGPGADPFVEVGDVVGPTQQVGIIEAMKLMIPVEAGKPGRITAVLKDNMTPAEYGEPLFALVPVDAD